MGKETFTVQVEGLAALRKRLTPELYARATRHILQTIGDKVAAKAREDAPASIRPLIEVRVSRREPPHSAVVRIRKAGIGKRAIFIHGPIRETGRTRTKPHMPPFAGPLTAWARERGIPVGAAAASIAQKGTAYKPFLRTGRTVAGSAGQSALSEAETLVRQAWG